MSEEQDRTKGESREERRRKRRFSPRIHGRRLAEIVRNALSKRAGRSGRERV